MIQHKSYVLYDDIEEDPKYRREPNPAFIYNWPSQRCYGAWHPEDRNISGRTVYDDENEKLQRPRRQRLVGGGIFAGREDTLVLEQLHQGDGALLFEKRQERKPAPDDKIRFDYGGALAVRPEEERKRRMVYRELNKEIRRNADEEHRREHGQRQILRKQGGRRLGVHMLPSAGLHVMLISGGNGGEGEVGEVTRVETSLVTGDVCSVTWQSGAKSCHSALDLVEATSLEDAPLPPPALQPHSSSPAKPRPYRNNHPYGGDFGAQAPLKAAWESVNADRLRLPLQPGRVQRENLGLPARGVRGGGRAGEGGRVGAWREGGQVGYGQAPLGEGLECRTNKGAMPVYRYQCHVAGPRLGVGNLNYMHDDLQQRPGRFEYHQRNGARE